MAEPPSFSHRGGKPPLPSHRGAKPPLPSHRGAKPPLPSHRGAKPPLPSHRGAKPPPPPHRGAKPPPPPHRGAKPPLSPSRGAKVPPPEPQRAAAPLKEVHDLRGHHYFPGYLKARDREQLLTWLQALRPIWEQRYSTRRAPPAGQQQRELLRPVYWLGNWQFACLDYYRPPRGTQDRCVAAEPFPEVLARIVADTERRIAKLFPRKDIPAGYRLNTCLVNFYGARRQGDRWLDTARVGEHRDFEPGPVASLSLGERALFQFVRSRRIGEREAPLVSQWLDDGSLQIFGGSFFKDRVFHRVQRVDKRAGCVLPPEIDGFSTRRVNFTFRFVPNEHVIPFAKLRPEAREDVRDYVEQLAQTSPFFERALSGARK